MITAILILLGINVLAFVMFAYRKFHWGGFDGNLDELGGIIAIGGSFGAFIAMRLFKQGTDMDIVFKISIPVSMAIQALTIGYLILFELGFVK